MKTTLERINATLCRLGGMVLVWAATAGTVTAAELNWLTDISAARETAARENKIILINFTGSDWCGWCKRLKREVFDQPGFVDYAAKNLVLVEADFPHNKPQGAALQRANEALAAQHHVEGYPTLVVLNSAGNAVGRTGYQPGGPGRLIAELKKFSGVQPVAAPPLARNDGPGPVTPPPAWNPPNAVKVNYDELKLKGISGTASRRFALINNETLQPGETGRVKLKDKVIHVRCLEIRATSVLVKVDGEDDPKELLLD